MISDELSKLRDLHAQGALSDEEFARAKEQILAGADRHAGAPQGAPASQIYGLDVNTWCMLMHLSQLCNYAFPLAGVVIPIVMWAVGRDQSPEADKHGMVIINWMITAIIMAVAFGILSVVLIGIPLLIILGVLGIVFPIIGAVKANDHVLWPYPLSIKFMRIEEVD